MSWLSPKTLRGWLVLIVLAALAVSQIVSFAVLTSQQTVMRMALHEAEAFRRMAGVVRLARNATPEQRRTIAAIASGPAFRVQFSDEPAVEAATSDRSLSAALAAIVGTPGEARVTWAPLAPSAGTERVVTIKRSIAMPWRDGNARWIGVAPLPPVPAVPPVPPAPPAPPALHLQLPTAHGDAGDDDDAAGDDAGDDDDEAPFVVALSSPSRQLDMAVEVSPGVWLNVATAPPTAAPFAWPLILAGGSAAVLVAFAAVWAAGRLARPLAGLAGAAERFGRGDDTALAPEDGPSDLRRAAAAFNTMASRVRKTMSDQRALLSAVGHDLRTPISSLRIRTEMVKDPELQSKMAATLDDMQRLTEAALAAARGGDSGELSRALDLPSLVQAVADDMAETGAPVTHGTLAPARVEARPSEVKRALRNLIENATRYGGLASVSIETHGAWAEIHVDDSGPGIPADALARVFEPFVRLEESRSADTGGHGLGLTIARAIATRHGGNVALANRREGGLRATLRLPLV